MRYGIFADVHSNLEAFESVLKAYQKERIDAYVCAGDIVGYGADPSECIARIKDLCVFCVAGNHDWAASGKIKTNHFNDEAKDAIEWTSVRLTDGEKKFLNDLGLVERQKDFIFVHGTLNTPQEFDYLDNFQRIAYNFEIMDRVLCFVGHLHVPHIFIEDENKALKEQKDLKVYLKPGCRYLVNVGSVGQPRDGDPRAAYAIFDPEEKTIEIKRVDYDVKTAKEKILSAGLPPRFAHRLDIGR